MNSKQFLDAVKHRHHIPSDNKLAGFLGVPQPRIAEVRTQRRKIDDRLAITIARALEVEPEYVMASVQAERAKNVEVRRIWKNLAATIKRAAEKGQAAALAIILFAAGVMSPVSSDAALGAADPVRHSIHYTHKGRSRGRGRSRKRRLRALRRRTVRWLTVFRRHRHYCSFDAMSGAQGAQLLHGS